MENLQGTIVGVPVVNVPSLLRKKRRFVDGSDLNHIMPGKPNGTVSQVYAWRVVNKIVKEYIAPEDGIVIGRSVNPINQTGGRILHLGILKD